MSTLLDGLQAYYKFDEATGTLAETSVGSSDITMSHSGILGGAGKINNGADFSGGNNRIGTGSAILTGTTDFAIGMWARFPDNAMQFFFDNRNGTQNQNRIFFSRQSNTSDTAGRRIRFFYNVTTENQSLYSTSDVNDNEWYLLGFQSVGTTLSIWINGVQNNTLTRTAGDILQTGTWKWGNHYIVSGVFTGLKGNLDEAFVYNRGLTSDEWLELANSGDGLQYPFSSGGRAGFLMKNF